MKKEQIKHFFSVAVSVLLVIGGIALMVQCLSIYRSGDRPFSREIVAAHFQPIAPVIYLCLATVALGFILELLIPSPASKAVPAKQYRLILQRLQESRNLDKAEDPIRNGILAQQKKRQDLTALRKSLILLFATIFLAFGCRNTNYDSVEINDSMISAMKLLLPCCAVPFAWSVFTAYQEKASLQTEIELWKQIPANPKKKTTQPAVVGGQKTTLLRNALLIAGICLMVYGLFTGGTNDVLTKAINICTECVGLG